MSMIPDYLESGEVAWKGVPGQDEPFQLQLQM